MTNHDVSLVFKKTPDIGKILLKVLLKRWKGERDGYLKGNTNKNNKTPSSIKALY